MVSERCECCGEGKDPVNEMDSYIVLYREAGDEHPANPPLLFHCQADDGDHAEEQCLTANPDCTVAWTYRGIDWHGAFDDYYREQD